MVWDVIAYNTRSLLVLIRGTMASCTTCVATNEMAARSHFSTRQCSASQGKGQDCIHTVITLPCPARFPDLSPIEHIWDHLRQRVGHSTSLNELEARLQQIWNEMSQEIIQNLYVSMPDRIVSCIRARGCSIEY
ncbi:transposable element Tcb1 transposase [Trichonephila clavipes]|nr:transposable element Tcb1 transposase [Trichonephila clavipes]